MICPYGREVGDPPSIDRCPSGFPGCACGDDFMLHAVFRGDGQSDSTIAWWENHGNEWRAER